MSILDKLIDWAADERLPGAIRWALRKRYWPVSLKQRTWDLRSAAAGASHPLLGEYLLSEFPEAPVLHCAGHVFPVAVYRCPGGPIRFSQSGALPNQPLELDLHWQPDLSVRGKSFYFLHRYEISAENHPTFVMRSFDPSGPRLVCGVSTFFEGVETSHELEWELYRAVGRSIRRRNSVLAEISNNTPLRRRLFSSVPDPLRSGDGRAASVGLSVLIAYSTQAGTSLLLRRRGPRSIVYDRGRWHVIPSGMFQSPWREYQCEFSPLHAFLWEYIEELFDKPDPDDRRAEPTWFYSLPQVAEMRTMLDSAEASLWLTGIAVNLASLRPELLMLLHIRDPDWYERHATGLNDADRFRVNREFADPSEGSQAATLRIELSGDQEDIFRRYALEPKFMVPAGAAALHAGIWALARLRSDGDRPGR